MHGNPDVAAQAYAKSNTAPSNGTANGQAQMRSPMTISPYFCPAGVDPFDTVEWESRTAQIKDETGGLIFEQTDCQIPKTWSPLATNVVVSKYFYGEPGTGERETSVRQVIHRVARTIADWGTARRLFRRPRRRRELLPRTGVVVPASARGVQLAGVVQRGACSTNTASKAARAITTGTPKRT